VYSTSGVAVNGYDVVSYFTELKPVRGSKEHSFKWKDTEWMFSSSKNLELFKSDPEKYAPQFGGYCAFGTAEGHTAPTKPDAWTVVDDKLYLTIIPMLCECGERKNWNTSNREIRTGREYFPNKDHTIYSFVKLSVVVMPIRNPWSRYSPF
jgi:YHS domain-containing protein